MRPNVFDYILRKFIEPQCQTLKIPCLTYLSSVFKISRKKNKF